MSSSFGRVAFINLVKDALKNDPVISAHTGANKVFIDIADIAEEPFLKNDHWHMPCFAVVMGDTPYHEHSNLAYKTQPFVEIHAYVDIDVPTQRGEGTVGTVTRCGAQQYLDDIEACLKTNTLGRVVEIVKPVKSTRTTGHFPEGKEGIKHACFIVEYQRILDN